VRPRHIKPLGFCDLYSLYPIRTSGRPARRRIPWTPQRRRDGAHGPHVVCQGAEARRGLIGERGSPGHAPAEEQECRYLLESRFLMREERDRFEKSASRRAVASSLGAGLAA
jgi:hypothetical protein